MKLTTDVIVTYQDAEQEMFKHTMDIDTNYSNYGLEKSWITDITKIVSSPYDLVKISVCVYDDDNTPETVQWINERLTNIIKKNNGKYFFQPDQRREITKEICKEYPHIAKDTLSHTEWLINQGLDPIEENFNYNLIESFNHVRIDAFKKKYHNFICRVFSDVVNDKDLEHIKSEKVKSKEIDLGEVA